ncbi:MAG TPA: efflux RND transporter periplasmic adaptor subunit [Pyrinomonadaceae bacterium]|nr:efflux RND transporter periplasmic adaptor subunit [Pyrinomonadaceae bacterium]
MRLFKFISFSIVTLSLALFAASCGSSKAETNEANANKSNATQIVEVTTENAIIRNLPTYFEATGTLGSDAQTDVAPTVAGKIIEVNFDVGSYVNKGDVLVRLDPRDAQIRLEQAVSQVGQARAQVDQAKAAVKQAEAAVEQARANMRQQQIRLGLTEGYAFDINKFSQVLSVRAQLELAEKELKRAEKLLETGDVSRSFYDQRKSQRDALLGQLEEAKSNAAVAIKAIQTAMEAVKTAQAQVGIANANVGTAQAAYNTSLSTVDQAKKFVNDTAIYAPISGYISERVADLGEYTNPSAPNTKICTILRTSILRLRVDVPEQNIGKVSVGQSVSLKVAAYPDRNFAGTIARILPAVNTTSRTLTVEAEIESGGILKPGLFATARIAQSKAEPTVLVPSKAVRTDGGVTKVFVIQDGRAVEKLVQLGDTENDMVQVKTGLKENEKVAVSNVDQLFDGVTVRQ